MPGCLLRVDYELDMASMARRLDSQQTPSVNNIRQVLPGAGDSCRYLLLCGSFPLPSQCLGSSWALSLQSLTTDKDFRSQGRQRMTTGPT